MRLSNFIHTFDAKGATSQVNFVNREESLFWVRARRNRLLADWACDLTDENNQAYLRILLDIDFAKAETDEAVTFMLVKIRNDLMGFGVFLPMSEIAEIYRRFEQQARLEL